VAERPGLKHLDKSVAPRFGGPRLLSGRVQAPQSTATIETLVFRQARG
jgi:hypothetical protein